MHDAKQKGADGHIAASSGLQQVVGDIQLVMLRIDAGYSLVPWPQLLLQRPVSPNVITWLLSSRPGHSSNTCFMVFSPINNSEIKRELVRNSV
ncbi:hypothetical protein [Aquitalea sp.]|uniref:hypothetical protein n=1 Tax=Aquitalea sp. TaxID=1872623 RepID=UPI00258BD227|nr:hypothetical protein [Aquitalea sp.]